ncbi:MAG: hypothetical protein A2X59_09910 [Nitrospirae bacterium GWC2_42_7]|nr:MAG: hypothetical protein A2X59_09910 [Nitrospirae bacterium GWC2_42_7]
MSKRKTYSVVVAIFLSLFIFAAPGNVFCQDEVVSGPFSLTILGGAQNDSLFGGVEGRVDYLNPVLNVHVSGFYNGLDASRGMGRIDNQRYGAGVAVSHTYPGKANAFLGTAFVNELGRNLAHVYAGGKYKMTDNLLLSGAYGKGFGGEREYEKDDTVINYEASDWLKFGVVFVPMNNLKANFYVYDNSPFEKNIYGLEGEVSYNLNDSVAVGVRGMSDLASKSELDKNWTAAAFVTYSFGGQKGKLIDVALEKNNPIAYPRVTIFSRDNSSISIEQCLQQESCDCLCGYFPDSWQCSEYCYPE